LCGAISRSNAETWQQLKQRSAKAGVTPSIALTAAFARILGRWGGSRLSRST